MGWGRYARRNALMSGAPPPTYVCNRCQKSGHWPKNCPLAHVRITTGIPSWELLDTTPEDPHAMQTKQGPLLFFPSLPCPFALPCL